MASQGPPFKVRAIFDYESNHDDDLTFVTGEIITVISVEDDDWYLGGYTDKVTGEKREGIFPMNFVEKIVAELPPRPSRIKKAPEPKEPEPIMEAPTVRAPSPTFTSTPQPVPIQAPKSEPVVSPPPPPKVIQPTSAESVKAKLPPPPPAEKSQNVASSFRDRIAAFNKLETQAPIKPAAPWVSSSSKPNFVKKPFVPPPPSKNAYIPPVVSHLPKPRRDEDVPRDAPDFTSQGPSVEEAPVKISSLKDRIAALQNMHLDPTGKPKSKPPKPKPRTESESSVTGITPVSGQVPLASAVTEGDLGGLEIAANEPVAVRNMELEDTVQSKDTVDPEQSVVASGKARKSVEIKRTATGFSDEGAESAGDADVSSSGGHEPELIEPKATSGKTTRRSEDKSDDDDESVNDVLGGVTDEGAEKEEDEGEEGIDPEVARRLAVRERIMKMSGGMGMHGMVFGPPMGGMPPKKKATERRASGETEKREEEQRPTPAMVPIFPMGGFGLPGMKPAKQTDKLELKESESDSEQLTSVEIPTENVNDEAFGTEDSKEPPKPASTSFNDSMGGSVVKIMERAPPPPPPVPQGLFNVRCNAESTCANHHTDAERSIPLPQPPLQPPNESKYISIRYLS